MKIGITGATGFIGKQLCKKLVIRGNKVTAIIRNENELDDLKAPGIEFAVCDLRDKHSVKGCLKNCQYLYHLANVSKWWLKNKEDYFEINVNGTQNIMEEALRAGVQKVIYTSSVAAIRQPPGGLCREELEHCGDFESLYGKSKYLAEQTVLEFSKRNKIDTVILNPGVVIGPGDFKTFGQMLLDFLNDKLKFRIFDDCYIPLVYIDDVIEAHILALEKCRPGEKYIITGENIQIIDIFRLVHKITGKPIPRYQIPYFIFISMAYISEFISGFDGKHPKLAVDAVRAMQRGARASNEKATRDLGIQFLPAEQALDKTITWYKNNGYAKL